MKIGWRPNTNGWRITITRARALSLPGQRVQQRWRLERNWGGARAAHRAAFLADVVVSPLLIATPFAVVVLIYRARVARLRDLKTSACIAADLHDDVGSRLTKGGDGDGTRRSGDARWRSRQTAHPKHQADGARHHPGDG